VVLSHAEASPRIPLMTLMEKEIDTDEDLIHKEFSEVIIGASMTVLIIREIRVILGSLPY
jgi:hypothetical protein